MKRLFVHPDRSLRIGPVTIVLFLGLIVLAGGLLRLNRPADETLVQVRHLFRNQPVSPAATEPEPVVNEEAVETIADETSSAEAAPAESVETPEVTPVEESPPVAQIDEEPVTKLQRDPIDTVTTETAATLSASPVIDSTEPVAEVLMDQQQVAAVDEFVEKGAEPEGTAAESVELTQVDSEPDPFQRLQKVMTAAKPSDRPSETTNEPDVVGPLAEPNDMLKQQSPGPVHSTDDGVMVSGQEYQKVFQAWRASPSPEDGHLPGLLVENLRSVYPLLQMKPVVIVNQVVYDLEDGSRLSQGTLDRYAETVFRVSKPWNDWGPELRRIGLKPGQAFDVRYYMHGYVRNGIYGRTEQAIKWCREQGLFAADLPFGKLEVQGRAYAVKQDKGGQFAVFVPRQLRLENGHVVEVSPDALGETADVALLKRAGLI